MTPERLVDELARTTTGPVLCNFYADHITSAERGVAALLTFLESRWQSGVVLGRRSRDSTAVARRAPAGAGAVVVLVSARTGSPSRLVRAPARRTAAPTREAALPSSL
jgi:hypothetical protein